MNEKGITIMRPRLFINLACIFSLVILSCIGTTEEEAQSPEAPIIKTITIGNGEVTIEWDVVSGAVEYIIYRDTVKDVTDKSQSFKGLTDTRIKQSGLKNGVTYYFRVAAINKEGLASELSIEKNATPKAEENKGSGSPMTCGDEIMQCNTKFEEAKGKYCEISGSWWQCKDDKWIAPEDDKEIGCNNSSHPDYKTIVKGKETREYILHVPTSYDSTKPVPLIINFHGFGGCVSIYSKNVGDLQSVADKETFIVAYPQAVVGEKGSAYWDPGNNGDENIKDNDAYFTEQLILDIGSEYNLDTSRVYAIGYSNGGMMSYGLACSKANRIAAIGVMSGTMLRGTCDSKENTSVIIFHGIADGVLPYEGNQDYQSVSAAVDFWLNHNGIPDSNMVTTNLNGDNVIRKLYTGGKENTSVSLYTVNKEYGKAGGHVWFSDKIDGSSPNQILWDFLSAYSLD